VIRIAQMEETMGVRGDRIPDCFHGGPHRYSIGHFLPDGSNRFIQFCRRCGDKKLTEIGITGGQMVDVPMKTSNAL